jgi:hypothetical protein
MDFWISANNKNMTYIDMFKQLKHYNQKEIRHFLLVFLKNKILTLTAKNNKNVNSFKFGLNQETKKRLFTTKKMKYRQKFKKNIFRY